MSNQPLLQMKGISKSFPGVLALNNVSFDLKKGEVHCLLGENGAGKSTLIKIISGVHPRDSGEIIIRGEKIDDLDAHKAKQLGVSVIYQEFNLVPQLSVAENIFLGNEGILGVVDWKGMKKRANEILSELGVDIDPSSKVRSLSTAEQQMIEIAKALVLKKDILIMDEPTASLTSQNTEELFRIINNLTDQGVSIVYISHRLQELSVIADRVTVLRDGRFVSCFDWGEVSDQELIKMMVGREIKSVSYSNKANPSDENVLSVSNLMKNPKVRNVSFKINRGEIVGFAGLVGSGRTELMRLIFGADLRDSGSIFFENNLVEFRSPVDAVKNGIGMLTEDRKDQGLVLGLSVRENVTLANLKKFTKSGVINRTSEKKVVNENIKSLGISTPSIEQKVLNLSGGNQQKVVLAKWLVSQCKLLIFDEPTRGIDVGAKEEIYQIMQYLSEQGVAIIMVSSDLPEILRMSDRIVVMSEGKITGELTQDTATQEKIMSLMLGGMPSVAQSS